MLRRFPIATICSCERQFRESLSGVICPRTNELIRRQNLNSNTILCSENPNKPIALKRIHQLDVQDVHQKCGKKASLPNPGVNAPYLYSTLQSSIQLQVPRDASNRYGILRWSCLFDTLTKPCTNRKNFNSIRKIFSLNGAAHLPLPRGKPVFFACSLRP